jgi:hypothetical protein
MHSREQHQGERTNRVSQAEATTQLRHQGIRKFGGNNRRKQRENRIYKLTFYNNHVNVIK